MHEYIFQKYVPLELASYVNDGQRRVPCLTFWDSNTGTQMEAAGGYEEMSSILADQQRPSYISPNAGGGGCGVSQLEQLCTVRHGAQMNFGDLTPYLTYRRQSISTGYRPSHSLYSDKAHSVMSTNLKTPPQQKTEKKLSGFWKFWNLIRFFPASVQKAL
jgi:hypothetical protein